MPRLNRLCITLLALLIACAVPLLGQQVSGSITGVVQDISGAVVPGAQVKATSSDTGLQMTATTNQRGSYAFFGVPPGTYTVTITKQGFRAETHSDVVVQGNRTATVNAKLSPGAATTSITVSATPLMNQTNATTGYVVSKATIQATPLGTGSFTQLAILSPGVHADFLGGAGANAGLGNQAIYADGNRGTSNSFSLNGISTNNQFNGNSTSQVGENRFVLNTGENFGAGGVLQSATSVYGAIGQALPTPPPDAIQEITVNSSMYDATQGNKSGAHIGVTTKSGTNHLHGSAWEQWQNSSMNAAPFFYNADNLKNPFLNRNQFGGTIGGPIQKNKLFYFASYQGTRVSDASLSKKDVTVPLGLTNDRTATGIINMVQATYGSTITSADINPVAMKMLNAKLPDGEYLIPSAQITDPTTATRLGYDAVEQGQNSTSKVDQLITSLDYNLSDRDRLSGKYYYQNNPTQSPFGAVGDLKGFPQQLSAGSQVVSISNNMILSPTVTWEQRIGFTRLRAYSHTTNGFTPSDMGMNLLGATNFPQFDIYPSDPTIYGGLEFGPSVSFGNAGMYQNQGEIQSSLNMVKGRHTISIGGMWQHTQLNIINKNTGTDSIEFRSFLDFVEGNMSQGRAFAGSASRYYRSNTAGLYFNDSFKIHSNLTLTYGLRWDYDGPFSEKYGKLAGFNPALYSYNAATDTITGSGLEIAGNNPTGATPGASNSLMTQHQWGFAPRIGIAWAPTSKVTVRAGYGIYYDRGELFSYFSPPAGSGFNGPFGVTLAPPFVEPVAALRGASFSAPFGTTPIPAPTGDVSNFLSLLPNFAQTACGAAYCWPAGNLFGPFLFGGYNIHNKLPYTENWTLDIQFQPSNNWMFEIGYVGNHGVHEILPIPFNMPQIATPQHPLWSQNPANEQIYSYGGLSPYSVCNTYYNGYTPLVLEPLCPGPYYAGNAEVRVPYMGYDMNSVTYNAEGISNYDALQLQVHKRMSKGFQFTASYTWSHALDMQSGLGLFVNGNNPQIPRQNYGSSDFDQTHVFLVNYSYMLPSHASSRYLGALTKGWTISGQTVAQSGQPYSPYDYHGSVGGLFFGTYDEMSNPLVPLKAGVTAKQAQLQGTHGVNAAKPVLNSLAFLPTFVAPGTHGVPPCDPALPATQGCDLYESLFGTTGRNMFRGPFQVRFDMSLAKTFGFSQERYHLRFEADAFNIFNQTNFDTPNNDVNFFPYYEGPPVVPPRGSLGYIQHTIGSPRFMQLSLHFLF